MRAALGAADSGLELAHVGRVHLHPQLAVGEVKGTVAAWRAEEALHVEGGLCTQQAPVWLLALSDLEQGFAQAVGFLLGVRCLGLAVPALLALREVGLEPLALGPKEGLALLNGTQLMSALGALPARAGTVGVA